MKRALRKVYGYASRLGLDPLTGAANLRGVPAFVADLRVFRRANAKSALWPLGDLNPCLKDRFEESGAASGHYFHQDLLVARRVHARSPHLHVDVGSRIDGFVAHIASFRPIEVFDIRALAATIPNVVFRQCDITAPLAEALVQSCDSLSCLHALEHFGLGRYGDPIDPDGHRVALANLARVVRPGGWFYLSVPIGPQRIEFNAHRVFAMAHLLELVAPFFEVRAISYVDDRGALHENVALDHPGIADSFGCRYGCGIVEMVRRA
ncbi:MAG: class I SAM-dependent methyltransferase [Burkholderiaceae bacterium]